MIRVTTRRPARWRIATVAAVASLGSTLLVAPAIAAPTDAVLKGVVTLGGQGVAGATVTLTALPGIDSPDGPYRQEPLAVVKTGVAGAYAIPLDLNATLLAWARENGDYVNYTVQVFYTDVSIDERLETLSKRLGEQVPNLLATPPDTSGLMATLNSLLDVVRNLHVMDCCPEGIDLAALEATISGVLATLSDLVAHPPINPAPVIADLQRQVGTITTSIDPLTEFAAAQGIAYSAGDFLFSQIIDSDMTDPVDDLTSLVLSTPDPVTLELTAIGAAYMVEETINSGNLEDSSCRSRYAPYVTVEARENNMEPVGEGHFMYDMSGKFDYGEHANTDLGGAYSFKGGAWEVSASANHIANKKSLVRQNFTARQAYVLLTGFRYRKERLDFTDDDGDGHVCRTDHRIVPEGWVSGMMLGPDVSSKDSAGKMDAARGKGNAAFFGPNTEAVKDTSRGHKYKGGVTAFGVGLHAQSSWSKQVDIKWVFGAEKEHWLYGDTGRVPDAETVFAW